MSRDEVRKMIDEVDENKDGVLDYGEVSSYLLYTAVLQSNSPFN